MILDTQTFVPTFEKQSRPYKRYGAAVTAWKSRRRELVLSGPAGTGKSRLCLEKIHFCADKYAHARILITRKTRESITQTAMVTYEKKVLPEGVLGSTIHWRTQEQEYRYPNGSIIAVGGLDKASKIMSSEWDMIYVPEATELSEEDWGALTSRLRNGVMPYQQLIADCNPSYPNHWLKRRADRGDCLMLESRHEDNPTVTPEYLATLDALPGVLKQRLRYGRWAAAEGMVYEMWNAALHVVSKKTLLSWAIMQEDGTLNRKGAVKRVVASVDWGYANPGVIQVYALDGDGRLILIREVYRMQRDIDWWLEQAISLKQEFGIELFVCDPAQPSYIEQFIKHRLSAVGATNDIAPGISALQARLTIAGDGRARFYVYEFALRERDDLREQAHRPCCFIQEVDAYAWPKSKDGQPVKEVPVKVDDHAMDCARYMCMYLSDPTAITATEHLATMQRRVELSQNRTAAPVQGSFVLPQKQRPFWEVS
jgi:PBSX family phage terminase large subunit